MLDPAGTCTLCFSGCRIMALSCQGHCLLLLEDFMCIQPAVKDCVSMTEWLLLLLLQAYCP
jgi:hypothetical protein